MPGLTFSCAFDSIGELWNNRGEMASARAQVLLAALCFGTTGTAQALGPDGTDPVGVGAARILVGGALLVAVALARRQDGPRWPIKPAVTAAAAVAVYQLAFFAAVADTGVAVGTIVALGSAPTLTGVFESLIERKAPPVRWAAATALACAGVALLALQGGDADISPLGVALAVTAGGAYAVYTLAAKRLLAAGHAPHAVMAVAFGLGALALLPALAATTPTWLLHSDGIALALFLGIVPTAVAYLLFANGLKHLSASETATLTLAEPLTAATLGAVILAEHLTGAAIAGAALVLAGLVALAVRPPPVASPEPVAA
jgi:DME family drug/metabolite transporter